MKGVTYDHTQTGLPRKHTPFGVEGKRAEMDGLTEATGACTKSPFNLFQLVVQKYTGNPRYLQSRDLWFKTCRALLAASSSPAHTVMLQAARVADTRPMCLYKAPSEWPFSCPDSLSKRLSSPFSFSVNDISVTFELHYLKQVTETF